MRNNKFMKMMVLFKKIMKMKQLNRIKQAICRNKFKFRKQKKIV